MQRPIVEFFTDECGDWVASLSCAHTQHVRHKPPFFNRPWVMDPRTREAMLGELLDCPACDQLVMPERLVNYKSTSVFDQDTVPRGLRKNHATAAGVWGRIVVLDGTLEYWINDQLRLLTPDESGVVVPELRHSVRPRGLMRFRVDFYRRQRPVEVTRATPEIVTADARCPPFTVQAVVIEDDTAQVLSAQTETLPQTGTHIIKIMTALHDDEPARPGVVVVKGSSPWRLHALVHDFDQQPSFQQAWVAQALAEALSVCAARQITHLGVEQLGCKHGGLSPRRFRELLGDTLQGRAIFYPRALWIIERHA